MIESVRKAMQILVAVSDGKGEPIALKEISSRSAIPKPTCSHLLKTLTQDGYLKRISHSAGYVLGPATHYLSRYGRYENEMIALARPVMRWMEKKTGATVVLSVIENHQKYIIEYFDEAQNLFSEHPLIRTDDIYRTATGRAILAEMSREEVEAVWEKSGPPPFGDWNEVTSLETLLSALDTVRGERIVISEGSLRKDSRTKGFAVPLFHGKACVGAVGLAWTRTDEGEEELLALEKDLCKVLSKGAREIQRRLSYGE